MILLYRRRWGLFYLPVVLAASLAIWACAKWLLPLPPRSLAIAIGVPQGGYAQAGERYRTELERRGLAVELVVSEGVGAQGPLHRLANRADPVQAGFAHGLLPLLMAGLRAVPVQRAADFDDAAMAQRQQMFRYHLAAVTLVDDD